MPSEKSDMPSVADPNAEIRTLIERKVMGHRIAAVRVEGRTVIMEIEGSTELTLTFDEVIGFRVKSAGRPLDVK